MKLTAIYAAVPGFDHGLSRGFKIVTDTFEELGETIEVINLAFCQVPYYDGIKSAAVESLMHSIKESDAVFFAAVAQMNAPCALLKTFLEHMCDLSFRDALRDKNCMVVTAAQNGGERAMLDYMSGVIASLGGFDAVRVCASDTAELTAEQSQEIIERQCEDFYKILRQGRKFILPRLEYPADAIFTPSYRTENGAGDRRLNNEQRQAEISELYKKYNLQPDAAAQDKDINDIARHYVQRFIKTENGLAPANVTQVKKELHPREPAKPREKTCKQLTQNLPHYFNPQMAVGIKAVFQFSISGGEGFEGYIKVDNSDCSFEDGISEVNDIVILTDDKSWTEILKGKYTAQKAFMIGRIKVRGNFMLLSKFDTLFANS